MGFTVAYLRLLEEKTGLTFELVAGTWEKNYQRFRQGQVDMISAISYTEERTEFIRYTDPYYIIPTVVYIREGDFAYQGVKSLRDKTVGIESAVFYRQYLQEYPRIQLREVEDTGELMQQLSFGKIDAVVTNINIGNYMKKKFMLENVALAGRTDISAIKDEDLRFGVAREHSGLHAQLRDGMSQITLREYKTLQDRWVGFTPSDMLQDTLLPGEYELLKQYRQQHGGLRLGSQGNWQPVDFYTPKKGHQGIAADVFNLLHNSQDVPLHPVPVDSFAEALTALQQGRIDVLPAVVPSRKLQDKLAFTKPYLSLPLVIATRRSEIFIQDLGALEHKRIGYVARGSLGALLKQKYPRLTFVQVPAVNKGLERVRNKQDFAFVGSVPAITYAISRYDYYNIKVSGTLKEKLPLAAAVQKGNPRLLGVLQKSLGALPLEQRQQAVDSWISMRFDEQVDYTLVWTVAGVAVLVVVLSMAWARKVQVYNARINAANRLLAEKNQQLQQLSVTDTLTGLYNRSKLDQQLAAEQMRFNRSGQPFSLVLLDIDWFKSINDTCGHVAGDQVLVEMARLLQERCRQTDVVGRWGGEEFLVLCPDTGEEGALQLAEAIRYSVASHDFGIHRQVTLSAGVVAYATQDWQIEDLVRQADQRLYQAKETKNQVVGSG